MTHISAKQLNSRFSWYGWNEQNQVILTLKMIKGGKCLYLLKNHGKPDWGKIMHALIWFPTGGC